MNRELLQQALDALRRVGEYGDIYRHKNTEQSPYTQIYEAIDALNVELTEPEQEPVSMLKSASVERAENAAKKLRQRNNAKSWDDLDRETVFSIDALVAFANFQFNRANTASPRKPWVGLTDDEVYEIANFCKDQPFNFYAKEIQTKLKELNT